MSLITIDDLADPRIADYRGVPDPALLRCRGLFVAEGRLVVRALLRHSTYRCRSLLLTATAAAGLADILPALPSAVPVYICSPELMRKIVGFNIHRGCLALGERAPREASAGSGRVYPASRLMLALERVGNADNIGGVFRNAMAFGVDEVWLSPGCCDPLYRKAIRVSIAGTLRVPFTQVSDWPDALDRLRAAGFALLALTPDPAAGRIQDLPSTIVRGARHALLVGNEFHGLSAPALERADIRVRIPVVSNVDSLNIATAAGIALYWLSRRID